MKAKTMFILLSALSITLTSCNKGISYKDEDHLDDYVHTLKYHTDFNILQLTDIHWNINTPTNASKKYLEKVLKEADRKIKADQGNSAKIDLVEITGDQFMLSNANHVKTFLKFFEQKAEEYGFVYAAIWGNHDRHGLYNPNWLSRQFKNAKHCIYLEPEDDLYGRSNFIINLTENGEKANKTTNPAKWQIVNLDSGASFSETAVSPFRDYDYIRKDQTEWWMLEHDRAGTNVPTIAYYHIPQQDNQIAWDNHVLGGTAKNKFFKLEGFADNGTGNYDSDFITKGSENNLKAAFMGHAHNVDWTVEYKGVVLGLGVKTGPELYFAHIDTASTIPEMQEGLASVGITENFDLIGASLVTIKNDADFELEHLYLNEREAGDFVSWVKW